MKQLLQNKLLPLLHNKLLPWLLLLLMIVCLSFSYSHNQQLSIKYKQLQDDKQQLIDIIDYKNNELIDLSDQHQANEQKLIEQKNQLQVVDALNRQYQQQMEQLINENEQLRIWSDNNLPDAVKRLHERPAIKGSEDYQKWLSGRNTVLPAGQ